MELEIDFRDLDDVNKIIDDNALEEILREKMKAKPLLVKQFVAIGK